MTIICFETEDKKLDLPFLGKTLLVTELKWSFRLYSRIQFEIEVQLLKNEH